VTDQQQALPRLRLQLAAAVREGDHHRATDLAGMTGATITEPSRRRWRHRRQPAFLRWMRQLIHTRRPPHGMA
jgi:hypothetical protein